MPGTRESILEAALRLPESERARLVQELLETLNPDAEGHFDDAWAAELDRRLSELRGGKAETVSWDELRSED